MNKEIIIKYLIEHDGLPEGKTWSDVAEFFNIQAPDKERAKVDEEYAKKAPGRVINDIWRKYKMKSVKQTYVDGKLKYETFKLKQEEVSDLDLSEFEITQVTTTPYGNPYVKLKKKEIGDNNHLEALRDILSAEITPYTRKPKKSLRKPKKALFLYFSDRHIGALTKDNSIYTNKYDYEEIVYRNFEAIYDDILVDLDQYTDIFIFDLGDALDGFNAKTTSGLRGDSSHTLPQQMNNKEQFNTYVKVLKMFFDNLVDKTDADLYFIATGNSNHGGDFDYMAMKTIEMYLNIKYPFIKTVVSEKFINHFIYGSHAIIFSHGKDDEDRKKGLPLIIDKNTEGFINDYIRVNKLQDYYITFVSGDLHQFAMTYGKGFRYLKVLSQYGGSKWIHSNFGTSRPGITYEVIYKDTENITTSNYYYLIDNEANTGITFS